jgi:hypothetical protein
MLLIQILPNKSIISFESTQLSGNSCDSMQWLEWNYATLDFPVQCHLSIVLTQFAWGGGPQVQPVPQPPSMNYPQVQLSGFELSPYLITH